MTAQKGSGRATAIDVITQGLLQRSELTTLAVTVLDPPGPRSTADLAGDEGAVLDVIWVQDTDDPIDVEVSVLTAGDPVTYDETFTLEVVCQSIRRGASATWAAVNAQCEHMLGEVIGYLASSASIIDGTISDPDGAGPLVAIADPTVDGIEAVVSRIDRAAGWLPDGSGYGCRLGVRVACSARIELS